MLDSKIRPLIDPPLNKLGIFLARSGLSANHVTLIGLVFALTAAFIIASGISTYIALVFLALSRIADGLDGAIARATRKTDFGGYFDIFCDFIFYGAIPFAFIIQNPQTNAIAGSFLLVSFYINAASFLGYAIMAEKRGMHTSAQGSKSLYYAAGLLEGTETILFFVYLCLWPHSFAYAAWAFGILCIITAIVRVVASYHTFHVLR